MEFAWPWPIGFHQRLMLDAQTAHEAVRKLQEEELALQAEDAGVRK